MQNRTRIRHKIEVRTQTRNLHPSERRRPPLSIVMSSMCYCGNSSLTVMMLARNLIPGDTDACFCTLYSNLFLGLFTTPRLGVSKYFVQASKGDTRGIFTFFVVFQDCRFQKLFEIIRNHLLSYQLNSMLTTVFQKYSLVVF